MKSLVLLASLVPSAALAWDPSGHMLIGEIAWKLSTPAVREKVNALAATLDNQFNAGRPYHFTTAGCWMDDQRALPKKDYLWSKWHYVDAEKTDDGAAFTLPEPPHVVWALNKDMRLSRDAATAPAEHAKTVARLFHWVGDIHQPMHTTTWNDRGGNGYLISGIKFNEAHSPANLHTFWDKSFRFDGRDGKIVELWQGVKTEARPQHPGDGVIAEQAQALIARFPEKSLPELAQKGDAEAWARASHVLGCTKAYPPGDHPGNTEVRKLEPDFVHASQEIAARQIVIAGHRLAALLDELFK